MSNEEASLDWSLCPFAASKKTSQNKKEERSP
jgi:hypothetical protein